MPCAEEPQIWPHLLALAWQVLWVALIIRLSARLFRRAVLKSGTATKSSPFAETIGDEVEFDFDSSPNDIAEGATPISASFIVDGRVRGYLVNTSNQRVTPIVTAICRVRR